MNARQEGSGLCQRGKGILLAQMAQEAHDEPPADAKLPLSALQRPLDAAQHNGEGHAASGVGLGVEEDLHVHHLVGGAAFQIGPGEVEEILLGDEHAGPGSRDRGRIADSRTHRRRARWPRRAGAGPRRCAGRGKHQFRLERAFDMEVQLQLGQTGNKVIHDDGSIGSQTAGPASGGADPSPLSFIVHLSLFMGETCHQTDL